MPGMNAKEIRKLTPAERQKKKLEHQQHLLQKRKIVFDFYILSI